MAGYREKFFRNAPSMNGRYQCVRCRNWFTKDEIDVDHRVPKRCGGTDDLYNLQAMCKHCNRSKGDDVTGLEVLQTVAGAVTSGGTENLASLGKSILTQKAKDVLGIKYRR